MPNDTPNNGGAVVNAPAPVAPRQTLVPATVAELKQQIGIIHQVLTDVMKNETHYGVVPGCGKKQVLLKPGAELIMTLFRIGSELTVEEFSDGFDVRYRVTARGFHIPTGNTIGYGIGEASTSEKKYKWRAAVCHEEYEATPETRRQIAYIKDFKGNVTPTEQVRQNPADILNTVLKMAKKRAQVDLCLTATACSDIFVQDIDDPDTNDACGAAEQEQKAPQNRYRQPQQRAAAPAANAPQGNVISDAQRKRLYAIGKSKGLSEDEMSFLVFDIGGVERSDQITRDRYDAVVSAFEAAASGSVLPREDGGDSLV